VIVRSGSAEPARGDVLDGAGVVLALDVQRAGLAAAGQPHGAPAR
jgi:hypothetical protein